MSASMERVCERCAGEDEELVLVRRPPATAVPGAGAGAPPTELWCFDCRTEHAHEVVDEGP